MDLEKQYKNWLLVGGTGRNIGKTTAAEQFINKLSQEVPVVGIKISKELPDEFPYHGEHPLLLNKHFLIMEEKDATGRKDSMRFLRAGARRSFFIVCKDEFLNEAFNVLEKLLKPEDYVVCESNGLRRIMKPGIFVMIKGEDSGKRKLDVLLSLADEILPALNRGALIEFTEKIRIQNGSLNYP
ncbi:MAG: hypothetical protein JXR71_13290 [Bacteroidales bacterium]|nr:hypothetical protein [Bacteroidales bacterium]